MSVPLSKKRIAGIEDLSPKKQNLSNALKILQPHQNTHVKPGEVVFIEISVQNDVVPPDDIYVISPNYILEDKGHHYRYDLKIPELQQVGPFTILILARWREEKETQVASQSLTLHVIDPTKDCLVNCLKSIQ